MPILVRIPIPFRALVEGQDEIPLGVNPYGYTSVREVMNILGRRYGGPIRDRIIDEKHQQRLGVGLFLNDEDIGSLEGLETRVKSGDVLNILPVRLVE
jgi:molybdopterin converting factor small subunit